ncbi:MAG: cytochrome c3 family protein [Candidatus Schekmanbacteria bacterium]|nr:cytochrome c3 family protein [Candidatus Schekmanbacteria bacterium]
MATVSGAVAGKVGSGPASPTLDFNGKSKHVANFPHHAHQERLKGDCKVCHHKDGDTDAPKACKTCHGEKAEGEKPAMKDAYHTRCKGCHQKEGKGPNKDCKDCHERK